MSTAERPGLATELNEACPHCDGQGMRIVEDAAGNRTAVPCVCRAQRRAKQMLNRARIPRKYENAALYSIETADAASSDESIIRAQYFANEFVRGYPKHKSEGRGLLLVGGIGVGKTHLGIAVLRALMELWDVQGLFFEYGELLRTIQHSYSPHSSSSEFEVLKPVFEAEVLMIDELGAFRPTDWVGDTVAHILNKRYSSGKTTIFTTNFPNLPEADKEVTAKLDDAQLAMRKQTLGERIGNSMHSRLQEMCYIIEMRGADLRTTRKRSDLVRM